MDRFVCVRVVMANAMDLELFQFDYDMSFAVTFMHPDRTVFGRYGSRQHFPKDAHKDISLEGLAGSMGAVLRLHEGYPANKAGLSGKQPRKVSVKRPEELSKLSKYEPHLNYEKEVARSCVHCHQIHDAQRLEIWAKGERPDDKLMFPWPMPDTIGFSLDPKTMATVESVVEDSPAANAGLKKGDSILSMDGQTILSAADAQWVFHHADDPGSVGLKIRRDGRDRELKLGLPKGWRRGTDISWRTSTWDLRRIALGGVFLAPVSEETRKELGISKDAMALRAKHVGQYNDHAVAKRAGIKKGDVYVSVDGQAGDLSETDIIHHILMNRKTGDRVEVEYLRKNERRRAKVRVQ